MKRFLIFSQIQLLALKKFIAPLHHRACRFKCMFSTSFVCLPRASLYLAVCHSLDYYCYIVISSTIMISHIRVKQCCDLCVAATELQAWILQYII